MQTDAEVIVESASPMLRVDLLEEKVGNKKSQRKDRGRTNWLPQRRLCVRS